MVIPLEKIGTGGTATVFVAVRHEEGEPVLVALKRVHAHLVEDERVRRELLREARLASKIDHENVVRVREVLSNGSDVELVMDYVEGVSLGDLLVEAARTNVDVPPEVASRIVMDAAAGLHAAHAMTDDRGRFVGVVHRDVSPQNILVQTDGCAKLTDFGTASEALAANPTTTQGTLKGKIGYMAPEYVQRGIVDARLDLFALGVVLWETLTGERLFRGHNEADTLHRVQHAPIRPPSELRPDLGTAFDRVVMRALHRDPLVRYPSAALFAQDLRDATALGPIAARAEVAAFVGELAGPRIESRRLALLDKLRALPRPTMAVPAAPAARSRGGLVAGLIIGALVVVGSGFWLSRWDDDTVSLDARSDDDTSPPSQVSPSDAIEDAAAPSVEGALDEGAESAPVGPSASAPGAVPLAPQLRRPPPNPYR